MSNNGDQIISLPARDYVVKIRIKDLKFGKLGTSPTTDPELRPYNKRVYPHKLKNNDSSEDIMRKLMEDEFSIEGEEEFRCYAEFCSEADKRSKIICKIRQGASCKRYYPKT